MIPNATVVLGCLGCQARILGGKVAEKSVANGRAENESAKKNGAKKNTVEKRKRKFSREEKTLL